MALSENEVRHIATLARLRLDDSERQTLRRDLSAILDYVSKLAELDLEGVSPTSHVAEIETPMRDDTVEPSPVVDEALAAVPVLAGRLVSVPRVIG